VFARHDGELLVVDEATRGAEGQWPYTRTVLLRFPDEASLHRWHTSPEYQAIAQHRFKASTVNVAVVNEPD
jgi:uncharacterized protein (DUF1330 family)